MKRLTMPALIRRRPPKAPWLEGTNIPWSDPEFSRRMLKEHLTQDHCMASRQFDVIDRQVAWIGAHLLPNGPGRVLDLCCGPGFYAHRLARLGHHVTGLDYSPASIEYAVKQARRGKLDCEFRQADVRRAAFDKDYDLVMLIYGELNVFKPKQMQLILDRACRALKPGGWLLLEPQTFDVVKSQAEAAPIWHTSRGGLFTDKPYLCLQETFWHEKEQALTNRFWVLEAGSTKWQKYAFSAQAYPDEFFGKTLWERDLEDISVGQVPEEWAYEGSEAMLLVKARKPVTAA